MKRTVLAAITALATMGVLVCGCTKDTDNGIFKKGSALSIGNVTTRRMSTKAVITGTVFPADEAAKGIGLFLTAAAGGNYDGKTSGYSNIKYSDGGSGWASESPIMLSATEGKLYGYFPYSASVTDLTAIPVESSLDGTDYMYATPVTGVNRQNPATDITMNHALARVSIKFVKDASDSSTGELTALSLEGACISSEGTLDAETGAVTSLGTNAVAFTTAATIDATGITEEFLLVPTSAADRSLTLKCTIDGKEYCIKFDGTKADTVCVRPGFNATVMLTLKEELSVSSVSIDDWQTVKVGEHKVTVKLEDDVPGGDVLVSAIPVSETSAEVRAISYRGTLLVCSRDDDESAVTPTVSGNYHYFTIDNITKDVVATVDYLKHTLSLTAVLDTMGTFKINGNPGPSAIIVDGTEVPIEAVPNANHRFVKWTDDESTTNPRTVTITSDSTFTAEFIRQWKVCAKLASGCEGMGTFKYDGVTATEKIADHGSTVVIHPEANDGYEFLKWVNENGDAVSNLWDYTFSNIDSDKSIKAVFVECIHEISGEPLPGVFTLADPDGKPGSGDETKIRFSKGNLWCDGTGDGYTESSPVIKSWGFENHQYDCPPHIHIQGHSWQGNSRVITHIGHFMWFSTASRAVRHFGQSDHIPPFSLFAENYFSTPDGGKWRVLTTYEWDYLFSTHPKKLGVNVNGNLDCIIVLPDNWDETVMTKNAFSEKNSYSAQEWSEMEAAGAVCLPCAGCSYNNASDIRGTATDTILPYTHYNRYWTPVFAGGLAGSNQKTAYCLKFEHSDEVQFPEQIKFNIYDWVPMGYGLAIRLVTDVK